MHRRASVLITASLGIVAGLVLPTAGRPLALLLGPALLTSVIVPLRSLDTERQGAWARSGIATLVGFGPGLVLLGVLHASIPASLPAWASSLTLQGGWTLAGLTLGRAATQRLRNGPRLRDAGLRIAAVLAVCAYISGALIRLLLPRYGTAERLAWILNEEDNAQIVGIAREILTGDGRGAELAEQFGTAFVSLPLALLRMFGGPLASEADVRLQAITVFLVSTIVIVVIAGVAMAVLAGLPHHVRDDGTALPDAPRAPSLATSVVGAIASAGAAVIGYSLLVVLPMRTGFLTFTWGLTIVLLGASVVTVTPRVVRRPTRVMLILHLAGSGLLLVGSWPFIGPALAPLFLVMLLWVRWDHVIASVRQRPTGATAAVVIVGLALAAGVALLPRSGPAAEVLSYGVDLLTVGASGISADRLLRDAAFLATASAGLLLLVRRPRGLGQLIGLVGPVAGASALYAGLLLAAEFLTGGTLGYAGVKLLYGVIVLAAVLGFIGLAAHSSHYGTPVSVAVVLALAVLHQASPTASLHGEWWDRTLRPGALHAIATVEAIGASSPELPIRCLPSPGTRVTEQTRWAAYFCARWMEDAFNEGRFDGRRSELLEAPGPTFEATVERIEAEAASEYLFAYRMTMGLGWFGWSGRD